MKPIIVSFQYGKGHNPKPDTPDDIIMLEMPTKPTPGEIIILNIPIDDTIYPKKRIFEVLTVKAIFYMYPGDDGFTFTGYNAEVKKVE